MIGTLEKEKPRAFTRGLDSSIKYSIRNVNPKTYEEALALAQNKELELNGGKPRQAAGGSANSQGGHKNQADKAQADKGKKAKPKQTLDEKQKVGVLGGFLSEERNAYMAEQRCFYCHTKGHRKQECTKWKAKPATPTVAASSTSIVTIATPAATPPAPASNAVLHHVPTIHALVMLVEENQKGALALTGLLRAYGSSRGR